MHLAVAREECMAQGMMPRSRYWAVCCAAVGAVSQEGKLTARFCTAIKNDGIIMQQLVCQTARSKCTASSQHRKCGQELQQQDIAQDSWH